MAPLESFLDQDGLSHYNEKLLAKIYADIGVPIVSISSEAYNKLDEAEKMKEILYMVDDKASVPTISVDDIAIPDIDGMIYNDDVSDEDATWNYNNSSTQIPSSFDISYKKKRHR